MLERNVIANVVNVQSKISQITNGRTSTRTEEETFGTTLMTWYSEIDESEY